MITVGKVINLFISNKSSKERLHKDHLTLDAQGIQEDKYYDTNVQRSVLITSLSSYALTNSYGIHMSYGTLGENLLIDYTPYHLDAGKQLQIGEVVLEISQNCTICEHLSEIDPRVPELLKEDRGIFARVIKGGTIHQNDKIMLV